MALETRAAVTTSMSKIRRAFLLLLFLSAGGTPLSYAKRAGDPENLTAADYVEIYNLYSAYSVALDTGNGSALIDTFTPDGKFSSRLSQHAPEPMQALLKRTNASEHRASPSGGHMFHVFMNIHIVPTANGAAGTCYAIFMGGKPDANHQVNAMPAYFTDTLVKTVAGWRFKSREVFEAGESAPPSEKNHNR